MASNLESRLCKLERSRRQGTDQQRFFNRIGLPGVQAMISYLKELKAEMPDHPDGVKFDPPEPVRSLFLQWASVPGSPFRWPV